MFRKEMEKYRDVDEDELLQNLSEEDLRRLEDELEELDPDVSVINIIISVLYSIISRSSRLHFDIAYLIESVGVFICSGLKLC